MIAKAWPNTLLWQRAEGVLRELHGPSWRRAGETLFGLGPGGLRAYIDNEHLVERRIVIENKLIDAMRARADHHRLDWINGIRRARDVELAFLRGRDYRNVNSDQLLAILAEDRRRRQEVA